MPGNLYVKTVSPLSLAEFGRFIAEKLNIDEFKERYSENYVNGLYLVSVALGVTVHLALSDDSDFVYYPYWIYLGADDCWVEDQAVFESIADLIARKLTQAGCAVARCPEDGRIGADIWLYTIKFGTSGRSPNDLEVVIIRPPAPDPLARPTEDSQP